MSLTRYITSLTRKWKSVFGQKPIIQFAALFAFLVAAALLLFTSTAKRKQSLDPSNGCKFPAIFNFGDSNSDTGGKAAMFARFTRANGEYFFGKASGRDCDGRLLIDFMAERLGLPYVSAYLNSLGVDFRHGANFATGGSTIQNVGGKMFESGFSPISLDVQVSQFEQFKSRVLGLYDEGKYRNSHALSSLPRPGDFSKALYTMDIGQNDLHAAFKSMTEKQVVESIPRIIDQFALAVEKLYLLGARTFWIDNTGPIGCLPYAVAIYRPKPENKDQNGCVKSHNEVAQEFNRQLKDKVFQLRKKLQSAAFTYTDVYSAKYTLISSSTAQGFANALEYCCGHYGGYRLRCGQKATVNGTLISGDPCSDPRRYISWDGIHYSQAANERVANMILDGALSDPQIPVGEACYRAVRL